jgi:hypothetical protein
MQKLQGLSPEEQGRQREQMRRDFFGGRGGMDAGGGMGGMGGSRGGRGMSR